MLLPWGIFMETMQGVLIIVTVVAVLLFLASRSRKTHEPEGWGPSRQDQDPTKYHLLSQVPGAVDTVIGELYNAMSEREGYERLLEIDRRRWHETLNAMAVSIFAHLLLNMHSISESTKSKVARVYLNYVRSKYPNAGKIYDEFAQFMAGAPRPPEGIPANLDILMIPWMFKSLFQRMITVDDDELLKVVQDIHAVLYRVIGDKMGLECNRSRGIDKI